MTTFRPRVAVADDHVVSNALSGDEPSKATPSMSGATTTVSKRCPGGVEANKIAERIGERQGTAG